MDRMLVNFLNQVKDAFVDGLVGGSFEGYYDLGACQPLLDAAIELVKGVRMLGEANSKDLPQ
jgi:hypothetical protein